LKTVILECVVFNGTPKILLKLTLSLSLHLSFTFLPLANALSNINDGPHEISQRDDEKKQCKDLPKPPLLVVAGLKILISREGVFDVGKEDRVNNKKKY